MDRRKPNFDRTTTQVARVAAAILRHVGGSYPHAGDLYDTVPELRELTKDRGNLSAVIANAYRQDLLGRIAMPKGVGFLYGYGLPGPKVKGHLHVNGHASPKRKYPRTTKRVVELAERAPRKPAVKKAVPAAPVVDPLLEGVNSAVEECLSARLAGLGEALVRRLTDDVLEKMRPLVEVRVKQRVAATGL